MAGANADNWYELKDPLTLTVNEKGYLTGSATFYVNYESFQKNDPDSVYTGFHTGKRIVNLNGIDRDPYGLVINGMRCNYTGMQYTVTIDHENFTFWLGEVEVECTNEPLYGDEEGSQEDYNFTVSIQSDIYTEDYRGVSFWDGLGLAVVGDKTVNIPYMIVTLSGDYRMLGTPLNPQSAGGSEIISVGLITSYMNSVNSRPFNLSVLSPNLGLVGIGCLKFVGFSYEENYGNTEVSYDPQSGLWTGHPKCSATFTFHIRSFDWNYKIRQAQIQLDPVTHDELYWQTESPNSLTYVDYCKAAYVPASGNKADLANTPIWVGQHSTLGGNERLGRSEYDKELTPVRDPQGQVYYEEEFPKKNICQLFPGTEVV